MRWLNVAVPNGRAANETFRGVLGFSIGFRKGLMLFLPVWTIRTDNSALRLECDVSKP